MNTLKIKASEIYLRTYQADTFLVVNQGGTSSGKTYSTLQAILTLAYEDKYHISVCSLAMPHLRKGALKDWMDILNSLGIYDENLHNKTDNTFKVGQSTIEFFSLDSPGKSRGPRRDILYVNEVDLIPKPTLMQLLLRTKKRAFLDFNPAAEFHYIYDEIITRDDCTFIQSTYRDNPFLDAQIIAEIERLKDVDANLWQVYGLGNRGTAKATIYSHWQLCDKMPEAGTEIYGLDFGFNNPTALVRVKLHDNDIYAEELLHRSQLTNQDLLAQLATLIPNKRSQIFADAAEPQRIEEIYRAGYNIKAADKSVKDGIDRVRGTKLYILNSSANLLKEIKSYKYMEDKEGKILEEPVKMNDHLLDAMRYAVHTYYMKPSGVYAIR